VNHTLHDDNRGEGPSPQPSHVERPLRAPPGHIGKLREVGSQLGGAANEGKSEGLSQNESQ